MGQILYGQKDSPSGSLPYISKNLSSHFIGILSFVENVGFW